MGKRKNNAKMSGWAHAGKPAAEVAALIKQLPEHLQPWVGRIVWWDRLSFGTNTPEFRQWIDTYSTTEPDSLELAEALIQMGYRESDARVRACGGDDQEKRLSEL